MNCCGHIVLDARLKKDIKALEGMQTLPGMDGSVLWRCWTSWDCSPWKRGVCEVRMELFKTMEGSDRGDL